MMILIAGPYRSATNDDPELIQQNVEEMESYALPIFRAGHIPMLASGWRCRLCILRARGRLATLRLTRYFIPLRCDCWKNAMLCCAWEGRRRAQMRWSAWAVHYS